MMENNLLENIDNTEQCTVIYRKGGRLNGEWSAAHIVGSYRCCAIRAAELEELGCPCVVVGVNSLANLGLPKATSYDYITPDDVIENGMFTKLTQIYN